ncbi:hypothetical protein PR001_g28299 [Phytophthora rubi]|uniref:Uncharacterized protein n=1 Tax=Phytophthora rubi TaxID=129364 RepID=A0A6A3H3A7_9STRA|nr:hypothetical protein PR002_g29109 [Phytophthora rubi]KAE8966761.1 hypothetical protein PR001_g28299 [Phytophthora rubi]
MKTMKTMKAEQTEGLGHFSLSAHSAREGYGCHAHGEGLAAA